MNFRLPPQAQRKRLRCGACRRVFRVSEAVLALPEAPSSTTPSTSRSVLPVAAVTSGASLVSAGVETQAKDSQPTGQDRQMPPGASEADPDRDPELEELRQAVFLSRLQKLVRLHKQAPGEGHKIMALVLGPVAGILVGLATSNLPASG